MRWRRWRCSWSERPWTGYVSEEEEKAGGDESTGSARGGAPPAYAELSSSHFGVLKKRRGQRGGVEVEKPSST